jgi:predicted transcriptional regulator of viral defense system
MGRDYEQRFRDALVVGSLLAPEGAAAYGTAMRWWGWTAGTEAEAKAGSGASPGLVVTFITPKRKQTMHPELLGVRIELVFVKPERMFGAALLGEPGLRIRVTDRERTVIDMLDRSDLCGGVPAAAAVLEEAWPALDAERLTGYLERFAGGTVPRRLGYLVERLGLLPPDAPELARWRELLGAGYSLLERGGPAQGPFVRRWRLRLNVPGLC